jgi:hypothetical protein
MLRVHRCSAAWGLVAKALYAKCSTAAASLLLPEAGEPFKAAHFSSLCASPLFLPRTFHAVFARFYAQVDK